MPSGYPYILAEAVSAACYTQSRSLVVKTLDKTPYQLFIIKELTSNSFLIEDQAEKLPNATITQDLEKLFNQWDEDEDDPDRTSADAPRSFAKQQQL
ncbi:hypothetical protein OSB04_024747 [Centaurea solstitialis]|uniref:Uncharacterized protein n=1 Tax=Centaurea solstitialis TaxID=347529 RepID=A0AA38SLQ0_9ASTR|nr:hypothetical protein OSB04_024747 [Centaurea solstitialis]